jgi:toxin ParE1/3/4
MRVVWSAAAIRHVRQVIAFIAADDPPAAHRWLDGLLDSVAGLALFPSSGHISSELGDRGMREIVYGAYLVSYRVTDAVEIVRVRHGAQFHAGAGLEAVERPESDC